MFWSSESLLKSRGKQPLCACRLRKLLRCIPSNSIIATGQWSCLRNDQSIADGRLKPNDINYINAHGTGTPNNDESEGCAIDSVFAGCVPLVSSTKSFTGHTTSASGSVEAVISILCLQNSIVPANLNFKEPMQEISFKPVERTIRGVNLKHILTNSFGFGGNNTSLIFSKI